jgi:hypothetical protein
MRFEQTFAVMVVCNLVAVRDFAVRMPTVSKPKSGPLGTLRALPIRWKDLICPRCVVGRKCVCPIGLS